MRLFFTTVLFFISITLNAQLEPFTYGVIEDRFVYNQRSQSEDIRTVLDSAFDTFRADSDIKGMSAAVLLPDGQIWQRADGLATGAPDLQPLTTAHLSGMGSISKSFVAATLLHMVQDGLLTLEDSIGTYITAYPNIDGSASIRQLLSHRTGFNDYLNENNASSEAWNADLDSIWEIDTVLFHFVLEPNFLPGESFSYSNTNYLIAGKIIENITDRPWYESVRERIIEPLALNNTFSYPWEKPESQPFAHIFAELDDIGLSDAQNSGLNDAGLFSLASSAGCLISNAEDLVKFSEAIYSGAYFREDLVTDLYGTSNYGLGLFNFTGDANDPIWGHNGDIIYKAVAFYIPSEKISIAVMQNDGRQSEGLRRLGDLNELANELLEVYQNADVITSTETMEAGKLQFYPNPAENMLTVFMDNTNSSQNTDQITIYNQLGTNYINQHLNVGYNQINVSHLPSGNYIIKMGGRMQKLMIQ